MRNIVSFRRRSRDVPRAVPESITRAARRPNHFQAAYVDTSAGFDAMSRMPRGLCWTMSSTRPLMMGAVSFSPSSHDFRPTWLTPVVMIVTSEEQQSQKSRTRMRPLQVKASGSSKSYA